MDELILEILNLIHAELDLINKRLTRVEYKLASVKEDTDITRTAVFKLFELADQSSVVPDTRYPENH